MLLGYLDPWKWASLTSNYKNIIAKVANCTDCAHCKDLHTPSPKTDAKVLTQIRADQLAAIKSWLKWSWPYHLHFINLSTLIQNLLTNIVVIYLIKYLSNDTSTPSIPAAPLSDPVGQTTKRSMSHHPSPTSHPYHCRRTNEIRSWRCLLRYYLFIS